MLSCTPVLAVNSGGPLETVVEEETGWLRPPDDKEWSAVMNKVLFEMSDSEIRIMGEKGKERVEREFSKEKMAASLQKVMNEMLDKDMGEPLFGVGEFGVLVGAVFGGGCLGFLGGGGGGGGGHGRLVVSLKVEWAAVTISKSYF